MPSVEVQVPLADGAMPGLLAMPSQTPSAGVVIAGDFFGRSPFYEDLARRLAAEGFLALAPDYFFRVGELPERSREAAVARVGKLDQTQTVADLAAVDWLGSRPEATGVVASMGFCMGGTLVLDLAASSESVTATVCYYGFPRLGARTPLSPPQPLELADRMLGPILGHWGDQDALRHGQRGRAGSAARSRRRGA